MNEYLRRLMAERDQLIQSATGIADAAAEANRDLTDTEQTTLAGLQARSAEIDSQLTTYGSQLDSQRAYAQLRSHLGDASDERGTPGLQGGAPRTETRSWGEQVTASDVLAHYSGRGTSDRIELPGLLARVAADPIMLANLPPGVVPASVHEVTPPAQQFPLISLVSVETVSTNSVDFVQWLPVPDTAAAKVAEGALKPAYDVTASTVSGTLDTYAGWKAITRQTLEDYPRIQSIVESKLRNSLAAAASDAIAALLNAAGAASADGAGSLSAAIRMAMADLQARGYVPNAVALNPADWAAIDISAESLFAPGGMWGLTPVAVPSVPAGSPVVGDFKSAITLFDRGQTSVFVTDSHADFFLRNQLVILAEARMLAATVEPQAMVKAAVGAALPLARSAS